MPGEKDTVMRSLKTDGWAGENLVVLKYLGPNYQLRHQIQAWSNMFIRHPFKTSFYLKKKKRSLKNVVNIPYGEYF